MCGICGVLSSEADTSLAFIARTMADTLRHRGPDYASVWTDQRGRGARPPTAFYRRPQSRRRATDGVSLRSLRHRIQWRDL